MFGGPTSEREVSISTKDNFEDLYKEYYPKVIEWGLDNQFYLDGKPYTSGQFINYLVNTKSSVIIGSHGECVEDGYIQEIFEKNGVPFTGSSSIACKLTMDKCASQQAVKEVVNIIPTFTNFDSLPFPFIAKPNNLGSSVGVYIIKDAQCLNDHRSLFSEKYIFQPFIKGTELSIGTVRSKHGFVDLVPTEIVPSSEFFDYKSKYEVGKSNEHTPARVGEEVIKKVVATANAIHELLGLGYYSRTDFILSTDSILYYLETNSLPRMTSTSLLPQQLRYSNKLDEFKIGLLDNMIVSTSWQIAHQIPERESNRRYYNEN